MSRSFLFLLAFCSLVMHLATVSAEGTEQAILFDQGHGQRFVIEDSGELQLSGLSETFLKQGAAVHSTTSVLNDDTLRAAKALVISGPFAALAKEEISAVVRFVENGGRLAVMLHIGQPLAGLLDRLEIAHSNASLREEDNIIDGNPLNFRVTNLEKHPLFNGITQFSAYGVWALNHGQESATLARTGNKAWVDLDGDKMLSAGDAVGAFSIVLTGTLGQGNFMVFGDDAIFQNRLRDADNIRLAENLGDWLMGR